MSYDDYLAKKMKEIEKNILSKHGIKNKINVRGLGDKHKRGRKGDLKLRTIRETFNFSARTLTTWRNGSFGIGRQRLYALLNSLDIEVYNDLQKILKMEE